MEKKYSFNSAIRFAALIISVIFLIVPLWAALSSSATFFAKMERLDNDTLSYPESKVLVYQGPKVASSSEKSSSASHRFSDPASIFLFGVGLIGLSMFAKQKIKSQ